MDKQQHNNAMRLESYDLAGFAGKLYAINKDAIHGALTEEEARGAKKVIATGCGDSYCAALAAERAFHELAGVRMWGRPAIEVSRLFDPRDFDDTLLFGISSRGRTSRVIEAALRVNNLGKNSKTVAIVNFKVQDSLLERECNKSIHVEMPVFECGEYTEHAPCQRSYFSTMFTQMLLAVRLGELRGNYGAEQAEAYRQGMIAYAEKFNEAYVDGNDDRMWELAKTWNGYTNYEVVGTANEAANVWFCAAKVVEAYGDIASYDNAENWLKINRYAKNPERIGTVLLADRDDEALEVALEAARVMAEIGRPTIVLTDADASLFPASAHVFVMPTTEYRFAKPLMQYSPLGNLLGYIKEMRGASFYRYGGENNDYIRELAKTVGSDSISGDPITLVR